MLRGVDHRRSNAVGLRDLSGLSDDEDKAPAAARFHHRRNCARQLPGAKHFGLKMTQERFARNLVDAAGQMRAGIAYNDIDPTKGLRDVAYESCDIVCLADIGDETFRFPATERG